MRYRVYLAGPISDGDSADEDARTRNVATACDVAARLIESGYSLLVPQLTVLLERIVGRTIPYPIWLEQDIPWLECADVVFRLPGSSAGSDAEVQHAQEIGIPVVFSELQLEEWRAREMQVEFGTGCVWGE